MNMEKGFGNLAQQLNNHEESDFKKNSEYFEVSKNLGGRPRIKDEDRMKRNIGFDKLSELSQEQKDIANDKINSHIKRHLKKSGFLEKINNYDIFDFTSFDVVDFVKNLEKNVYIGRAIKDLNVESILLNNRIVFNILQNIEVIDEKEFKENRYNLKRRNIVEFPNSAKDFFNFNKLKDFGFDDDRLNAFLFDNNEEIIAKNGDKISVFEIKVFQRLFGKLKAKRGEKEELLIWDEEKNNFVKFNLEILRKSTGIYDSSERNLLNSENILNKCPNLFELGLLRFSDFYINTTDKSGELLRKEFVPKNFELAFQPSINGVRYYLGKENFVYELDKEQKEKIEKINLKNLKAIVLDNDYGGVIENIDNIENLKYIFKLVSEKEKKQKREKIQNEYKEKNNEELSNRDANSRVLITKDEMNSRLEKWDITKDNPPKQNESQEDYYKRISTIGSYEFIRNLEKEFLNNSRIGIHNLSWKEQQWLSSAYYELKDKEEIFTFADKYGLSGLSTFLSCEDNISNAHKILETGELLDKKISDKDFNKNVFEKYSNILSLTNEIVDKSQDFFTKYFSGDFDERKLRTQLLSSSSFELNSLNESLRENDNENDLKKSITNILNNFDNISKQKAQVLNLLKNELDELEKLEAFYGVNENNREKKNTLIENAKEKIINLLYEKEIITLPENFQEYISKEILEYSVEIPDTNKNVYLPVGITSKPEVGGVEKPIDSLAYIFWLYNQKKNSELVVVDSIQKTNYDVLYNNGEDFPKGFVGQDSKVVAEEMGSHDENFYNTYKKTFNLDINISKYPREKDQKFLDESKYIEYLYKDKKNISKAFDSIIEKSIIRKAKENNQNISEQDLMLKLSQYPRDEVAIILAKNGLKISHEKEFRYDVLAKILSVYKLLSENKEFVNNLLKKNKIGGLDLNDHMMNLSVDLSFLEDEEQREIYQKIYNTESEIKEFISEVKKINQSNFGLRQSIDELERVKNKKSEFEDIKYRMINEQIEAKESKILFNDNKLSEISTQLSILEKQREKLKLELEKYLNDNPDLLNIEKNLNRFNSVGLFKYDQKSIVGIYSNCTEEIRKQNWFDKSKISEFYYPKKITGMSFEIKSENEEEKTGFREFYSSYTSNRQDWIYSNQIIANPEASIAKFSVLSKESQIEYFEKVIKPIIINYYVAIYQNKEEANNKFLEDFKNINSPIDALLFIKKNIIDKTRDAYSIII